MKMKIERKNNGNSLNLGLDDEPDSSDKKSVAELIKRRREQGPNTRQQSAVYVSWDEQLHTLGKPFDATRIPLSKLYQMRRDPMIAFALQFVKVPLIRAPWYIDCQDAQVAAFIDDSLRRVYARIILQYCLALDFGFSAIVKRFQFMQPEGVYLDPEDPDTPEKPIWDEGNVDAIVWKPFVALPPEDVEPKWTAAGDFNGINWVVARDVPSGFLGQYDNSNNNVKNVGVEHALWATNERDSVFGSIWGYPRIGYAYRYWWSYWYNWALADRHFEKDADPPMIARYPDDKGVDDEGNEVDYRSIALSVGEDARSGSTVAMPSTVIQSAVDGKPTAVPEWDLKSLDAVGNFQAFNDRFEYLDIQKLRSIMVPEQAFFEGKGGTSSRNVAAEMGDTFQESQAVLMAEIDDHINRFVIPQLVNVNFPDRDVKATKVTRGFGVEDMELAKQLVQLIGQSDPTKLEVDIREILQQTGVPVLSPEQVKRQKEEAMQELQQQQAAAVNSNLQSAVDSSQQSQPAIVPPGGGQTAGSAAVSATGFYIQTPGRIDLSEDHDFVAGLPSTKHYEDKGILALTRALRKLWKEQYEAEYEAFADYLSRVDFADFADDSEDSRIERILRGFGSRLSSARDRTKDIFKQVVDRAGGLELQRIRMTRDDWSPGRDEVADWIESHGAELVTTVSETTRKELRKFLADELRDDKSLPDIASAIRVHFSDFPDWKADRLARTEIRIAYNQATLLAAQGAGFDRVQALDATKGQDTETDPTCRHRNGRIYNVQDAFAESATEHPNGTLAWRILSNKNLSIERVEEVPGVEGALAYFDQESETVYIRDDISEDVVSEYLVRLGELL